MLLRLTILLAIGGALKLHAHAPLTPAVQGALRVRGNALVDGTGGVVLLRGANMPGLEVAQPAAADAQAVAAMTDVTFGVMRVRWNMNVVRVPVSVALWTRDGQRYLDQVTRIVRLANDNDLVVVLAACEDSRCGSTAITGMPSAETLAFWRAWAGHFKDNTRVIFAAFHQPSARNVPGAVAGSRTAMDWEFWLRGGTTANGLRAAGMQELVDTIRSTGAEQIIAVPAFHDALGFRSFTSAFEVRGGNVIYEFHPYYDYALSNSERDAAFGFLASRLPLYAGEWGATLNDDGQGCAKLPRDLEGIYAILFETLSYFDSRLIAWTAASFRAGSLIRDLAEYTPTTLGQSWTCSEATTPQPGIGESLIFWMTGDPIGFGSLRADQIASVAGGPPTPVAPGQLISIYVEQLGPAVPVTAGFADDGRLPTNLAGTQVLFDGVPAPVLYAGSFQINAQVPYSLAGARTATMQVIYRHVPSNRLVIEVVDAAPELFHDPFTRAAIALNEDGSRNGPTAPASPGSIAVLFATGGGQTSPAGATGVQASSPHSLLTLPVDATVGGLKAEVLFAGDVPGFVGLVQINIRLPSTLGPFQSSRLVPVLLTIGGRTNRAAAFLWFR
jgi:uncharacterized protein (TIGR03437 family)